MAQREIRRQGSDRAPLNAANVRAEDRPLPRHPHLLQHLAATLPPLAQRPREVDDDEIAVGAISLRLTAGTDIGGGRGRLSAEMSVVLNVQLNRCCPLAGRMLS